MSLLKETNDLVKLANLRVYLEGIKELGLDANDDIFFERINQMVEQFEQTLTEADRSEFSAGREMAQGAGVNFGDQQRNARIKRMGVDEPRLGLQAHDPEKGDLILVGGGQGVGQIVGMKGDSVAVRTKSGYTIEIPRFSLIAKAVPDNKNPGYNKIVWIEQEGQ